MACAILPYWETRLYDHVHDDHTLRGVGSLVTDARASLGDIWRADFFGSYDQLQGHTGFWRPLILLSFRLEVVLSGGSKLGYLWLGHVVTVLCHLAASLCLWRLLRVLMRLRRDPGDRSTGPPSETVPFLAAVLFALHPAHVESVVWTSGRVDSLPAALAWSGTLLWLRTEGRGRMAWVGGALMAVALLGKETAVLHVGLASLAGLASGFGRARSFAIPAAAVGLVVALRAVTYGLVTELPAEAYTGPPEASVRWFTWLSILPDLGRLSIWPGPATPLHPVAPAESWLAPGVAAGLVSLAFLAACVVFAWRSGSVLAVWATSLVLGTVLMLAPWVRFPSGFPEVAGPLYERYLYAAVTGPALALAWALQRIVGERPRAVGVLTLALLVGLGAVTARRGEAWSADIPLARAGLAIAPGSANLWAHLGAAHLDRYQQTGDAAESDEALRAIERALALDPDLSRAAVNRFILLSLLGREVEAERLAVVLQSRWPEDPFVLHNVAAWHEGSQRWAQAAALFERALRTGRAHPETAARLAACREAMLGAPSPGGR